MQNMYGKDFPSLSHRLIYSYMIPFSEFVYYPDCGIDEQSQRQFKAFLKNMLETLYNDPSIIDLPFFEDTYSWKEDKKVFGAKKQKLESKFGQFINLLIKIGIEGELDGQGLLLDKKAVRLTSRIAQLEAVGLEVHDAGVNYRVTNSDFPNMFAAYKYQAGIKYAAGRQPHRHFLLAVMGDRIFTGKETYGEFLPEAGFVEQVENYCKQNDFVCSNGEWDKCIAKWEKEFPKKKRIMFMVFPEPWKQYQVKYTVRVSDFQAVFGEFDTMSNGLKQMIIDKANPCGGCRYCVQTDKTGKKPIAVSKISHNGIDKAICSYYPFWELHEMDSGRAAQCIELLTVADRVLSEKYPKKKYSNSINN